MGKTRKPPIPGPFSPALTWALILGALAVMYTVFEVIDRPPFDQVKWTAQILAEVLGSLGVGVVVLITGLLWHAHRLRQRHGLRPAQDSRDDPTLTGIIALALIGGFLSWPGLRALNQQSTLIETQTFAVQGNYEKAKNGQLRFQLQAAPGGALSLSLTLFEPVGGAESLVQHRSYGFKVQLQRGRLGMRYPIAVEWADSEQPQLLWAHPVYGGRSLFP